MTRKNTRGTFTILDTDILNYDYEEFKDWYKEYNDVEDENEIPDDDSSVFWDWAAETRDLDYESDRENIKYCEAYDVPVVITGALGLWDGRHSIVPVRCNNVNEAIDRCNSDSILDLKVNFVEGHFEVYAGHHDGTNRFEIYALSKKGIARFDKAEERWEDVEELKPTDVKRLPYLYAIGY